MRIKKYHWFSFFFILVIGTFLHFTYKISGYNTFVGYFSSVNESPWEHLKLIFFPSVVFGIFEYFIYGKKRADFWAVKMTAIVSAMGFILSFFYTYSGILGFNLAFFDIADFIMGDLVYCFISYKMVTSDIAGDKSDSLKGITAIGVIAMCFILWTYNPPDLGVFWG